MFLKAARIIPRSPGLLHCENVPGALTCQPPPMPLFLRALVCALLTTSALALSKPTVPGDVAVLVGDVAAAPENAPAAVKNAIWAANWLRNKPYRFGGGHATFMDIGYDCSGTVSFLLYFAGRLQQPTTSSGLMDWGDPGPGKWITIYARHGHTYMVIAGLRIDTTGGRPQEGPRWRAKPRSSAGFVARHPPGL